MRSTATVHDINAQGIGPRLTCLSPAWPFPAGAANLTVQYNNVDGSFRSRVWGFEFFGEEQHGSGECCVPAPAALPRRPR